MAFCFCDFSPFVNESSKLSYYKSLAKITMANKKIMSSAKNLKDPAVVFTTYDIGVSTALLCAGFELLSVEKSNPRKALFIFRRKIGIDDIADKYFADSLEVKARSFFDNLKALKNKLYS